jgi:hypothetical protein
MHGGGLSDQARWFSKFAHHGQLIFRFSRPIIWSGIFEHTLPLRCSRESKHSTLCEPKEDERLPSGKRRHDIWLQATRRSNVALPYTNRQSTPSLNARDSPVHKLAARAVPGAMLVICRIFDSFTELEMQHMAGSVWSPFYRLFRCVWGIFDEWIISRRC